MLRRGFIMVGRTVVCGGFCGLDVRHSTLNFGASPRNDLHHRRELLGEGGDQSRESQRNVTRGVQGI